MSRDKQKVRLHRACPECPHVFPALVVCAREGCGVKFKKKRLSHDFCSVKCADRVRAKRAYEKKRKAASA